MVGMYRSGSVSPTCATEPSVRAVSSVRSRSAVVGRPLGSAGTLAAAPGPISMVPSIVFVSCVASPCITSGECLAVLPRSEMSPRPQCRHFPACKSWGRSGVPQDGQSDMGNQPDAREKSGVWSSTDLSPRSCRFFAVGQASSLSLQCQSVFSVWPLDLTDRDVKRSMMRCINDQSRQAGSLSYGSYATLGNQ